MDICMYLECYDSILLPSKLKPFYSSILQTNDVIIDVILLMSFAKIYLLLNLN